MRRFFAGVVAVALGLGCRPSAPSGREPDPKLRHDLELSSAQAQYLHELATQADASPQDFALRKASGLAHLRFALSGVLSLRDRAESDLEAAFALDPTDRNLTRTLGRFYNMRAVDGDDSKADKQVEVYEAHLQGRPVEELETDDFVAYSFYQLGRILSLRNRGQLARALGVVRDLEEHLGRRARADRDNVELQALAGNFAFFFAGNIPFGKKARVEAAVEYFGRVRARWGEMRSGAKDPEHCPNTYENFMFELAEGHLVLGQLERAKPIYEELTRLRAPRTRAKEQIAYVSAERLRNAQQYVGNLDLMPPWPSDVGNCVVCHAYTSDVPLTSLVSVEPIDLGQIPSAGTAKPLPPTGRVPQAVLAVVEQHCLRCHQAGEPGYAYADLSRTEGVVANARAIGRRVSQDEMPPAASLPPQDKARLIGWVAELAR